ncbi:energy-coupling factor transporter ATPase [Texcoconibacillus texcoconensis]|nr:energy-coupling factor transporter ATPase [Texcoconibacillus texcoconensis]
MQVKFHNVAADYKLGPIRQSFVLQSVNLAISSGTFSAVIGPTGSGKSSLLKVLNGLLVPKQGQAHIGDQVIEKENDKHVYKEVRKRVGMVFQFPESQLFAETVLQDICFGPINFGVPFEEAKKLASDVIEQVGLEQDILTKSPFSLSGGQKRRVAIAGILAMNPDILVLDEPGAGLDPKGKAEIMSLILNWHRKKEMTTLLVTHDMEDVAHYADEVIVMENGSVVMHEEVRDFFSDDQRLEKWSLELPNARRFQLKVEQDTGVKLPNICLTKNELVEALIKVGLA